MAPPSGIIRKATGYARDSGEDGENVNESINSSVDLDLEHSAAKPIRFQRFQTKTKDGIEQKSTIREQRLSITRALTQKI